MEISQIAKILFGQGEVIIKDYPFGGDIVQLGQKDFAQFTKNDWQSIRQLIFVLLQEKEKGKLQLLHDILEEKKNQLDESSLRDILLIIKLEIFEFLSESQQAEFLKNYLLAALKYNLDVKEALSRGLDYYYDQFKEDVLRQKFAQALADNQEDFISFPEQGRGKLKGKDWLKDYLGFSSVKEKGGLEELNYVNRNEKAKFLLPSERELLLKFLNLYDWLQSPKTEDHLTPRLVKYFFRPPAISVMDKLINYISAANPTPSQFSSYLKSQFPKPTDFKQILKILNDLKRRGYPQYLEVIYFDEERGEFRWRY